MPHVYVLPPPPPPPHVPLSISLVVPFVCGVLSVLDTRDEVTSFFCPHKILFFFFFFVLCASHCVFLLIDDDCVDAWVFVAGCIKRLVSTCVSWHVFFFFFFFVSVLETAGGGGGWRFVSLTGARKTRENINRNIIHDDAMVRINIALPPDTYIRTSKSQPDGISVARPSLLFPIPS